MRGGLVPKNKKRLAPQVNAKEKKQDRISVHFNSSLATLRTKCAPEIFVEFMLSKVSDEMSDVVGSQEIVLRLYVGGSIREFRINNVEALRFYKILFPEITFS
jgi:hypothetical protein